MYKDVIAKYWQINNVYGILKGIAGENFYYMAYLDKHIRAAGGGKSEEALLEGLNHA
jgi:formylmethanofuran:tetrahydromethanopterin formyltransferase